MKKVILKNIWHCIGILISLAAVIIGIVFLSNIRYYGSYQGLTFGADFYTESHKAIAAAVNAIREVSNQLRIAGGWAFILIGAANVCRHASRITYGEIKDAAGQLIAEHKEKAAALEAAKTALLPDSPAAAGNAMTELTPADAQPVVLPEQPESPEPGSNEFSE